MKLLNNFVKNHLKTKYRANYELLDAFIGAIESGSKDVLDFALSEGVSGTKASEQGLQAAARGHNKEMIEYFLEQGVAPIFGLIGASRAGDIDLVEKFMKLGANDQRSMNDAILEAAKGGHLELVKFFHKQGANPFRLRLCVTLAARSCRTEVLDYLRDVVPLADFKEDIQGEFEYEENSKKACLEAYMKAL